jgi:hypothetical protein
MALDYSNERYVRLYTRDTATWKLLAWEARALLTFIIRKVDRAGVIDVGEDGVVGLAAIVDMPEDVVEAHLPALIKRGCVTSTGTAYVLPNFIAAQEATASDKQRQRDSRERRRAAALDSVTERDSASRSVTEPSRVVTSGHAASQPVTPNQADPSQAEPSERDARAVGPEFPAPEPPRAAPGDLAPLVDFALDELNKHRRAVDPTALPLGEFEDQPGRRKLCDRLRETSADQRKAKLVHALTVLGTEARAKGDVGLLRLALLGGDAAWPRLQSATVKSVRARASPAGMAPPPALAPVGRGPPPVTVDQTERAGAASMLGDALKSLGIPT